MTTQGWGVWLVNEGRWRRATCDAHPDAAVVWRHKEDAEREAMLMFEEDGFGNCEARPFDWSAERGTNEAKEAAMELSKLYEQVTAVREDAVVHGLSYNDLGFWAMYDCAIKEDLALALIGWHWLGLMPFSRCLAAYAPDMWCVAVLESEEIDGYSNWYDGPGGCKSSPIEALAAYLLATAKEAK